MARDFLKGCVKNYNHRGLRLPINKAMMMPWVEAWIIGKDVSVNLSNFAGASASAATVNGKKLGVSNTSSRENRAVIKSFQFGMSNGQGVLLEVVDEDGGNFTNFFNKITTGNMESAASKYVFEFRFGWAVSDCGKKFFGGPKEQTYGIEACCPQSTIGELNTGQSSCVHRMVIRNITCNVSRGCYKFSIEASDLTMDVINTRDRVNYGTDRNPMRVVAAVKKMFADKGIQVKFLRLDSSCQLREFIFKKQGEIDKVDGPVGTWNPMNKNLIQATRDWLNSYISDRNKGIIHYWDSSEDGKPVLVFMETNQLTCESTRDMRPYNIGTYIVNGGAGSPVLSFTPSIQYVMDQVFANTSGVAGGALAPGMQVEEGPEPCLKNLPNTRDQGMRATQTESDNDYRIFGTQATVLAGRNKMSNQHANIISSPFTAEMRIQGDPTYDRPVLCQGHYVSIVYINPFRIAKQGDQCDWLATTGCNDQLSNSNWMIWKVFHEIKEGSFTTTLKLRLAAPGLDIPRNAPLGGMPGAPRIE